MNRSSQRNEEIIKRLQAEKQNYASEISNIRDLNSTVENKKEQIIRELTGREIENEQLQAAISDMKLEIDMLHTQINNEKAMVRTLEEIISSSREKEFQTQIHTQEKDSELQLARERANMSDVKMYVENKSVFCKKFLYRFVFLDKVKEKKLQHYVHKLSGWSPIMIDLSDN